MTTPRTTDESQTFKKRSGCTDLGKDYEHLYLAHLILKLITQPRVKNFQLSSNDDSYGAFDDVVLEVEYQNGTKQLYAIQLKHITKSKNLAKSALAAKSGNFSIVKYFEDWKKFQKFKHPIKFILLTNLKFDCWSGTITNEDGFSVSAKTSQEEDLLSTVGNGRCCQFVSTDRKHQEFFKNFFLYCNQASVHTLKTETRKKFEEIFNTDESVFDQYVHFVAQWSLTEGVKDKLNRNLVVGAVALKVLTPHIVPFKFSNDCVSHNVKVFREGLKKFPSAYFQKCHMEIVSTIWKDAKIGLDLKLLNKINRAYQVTSSYISDFADASDRDSTKLLWLLDLCPLPVVTNAALKKITELCQNRRFIIFGSEDASQKLTDFDSQSLKQFLKFKCVLQGKTEITLEFLLRKNDKIRSLITVNELVQMLDGSFTFGDKKEILPIPHIDRLLTRNTISLNFLNKVDKNTFVVITNVREGDQEKIRNSSVSNVTLTDIQNFLERNLEAKEDKELFYGEGPLQKSEFDLICKRVKNKSEFHQFRLLDDELEWVRSRGDIRILKEYQSTTKHVEQNELFDQTPDNKINIVCADPGMGKSILMKNLKNSSKLWTLLIQPKDHAKYFRSKNTKPGDFIAYILEKTYRNCDNFLKVFLEVLVAENQVMFIWDGLDEVAKENLGVIFDLIASLPFTQWLTSRCNLMQTLENRFDVLSRTIKQFDFEQQNSYIEKRLNCTRNLEDIKEKIHRCVRLVQYNDILGIPLQIYMFTELFRQNSEKYRSLLSSIFSITDLYRYFVDEKFNIYHRVKAELDDSNDVMVQMMQQSKNERLRQYEEAALKTYLRGDTVDALRINCDAFLEVVVSAGDSVGIIIDVTDDRVPSFLHNSYGEYFAASYLCKNYGKVPNFVDFFFEESFNNIRFLFDLLMAEDRPAHIAVLYKNIGVLEENAGEIGRKDQGGRSPLHLACSWGKRYSEKLEEKKEEIDDSEFSKIMNFLTEKCDPLELDRLFQMNSYSYADTAHCLLPILILINKFEFDFTSLNNFNDINTILFNSIRHDYADVFEDIPYVNIGEKNSLLHAATLYKSVNCLKKLVKNREYLKLIDYPDTNGIAPFFLGCMGGNIEILEILKGAGADINAATPDGFSAIFLAARAAHPHVITFLIESNVDVNGRNRSGQTALFLACQYKSYQTVSILLSFGADVNIGDNFGYTPLYMACRHKNKELIDILLENGADCNVASISGDLPLFMAAWNDELDTVRLLLDRGADINGVNKKGHGAIHASVLKCNLDVLQFLVNAGADFNAPNQYGQTPLHLAVRHDFGEGIVLLLYKGADVTALNGYGMNFWDTAVRHCGRAYVETLVVRAKGREYWDEFQNMFDVQDAVLEDGAKKKQTKQCLIM